MTPFEMVRQFHEVFKTRIGKQLMWPDDKRIKLRMNLIDEEAREFRDACFDKNIYEAADALGDLLYVTYGAAIELGIDLDKVVAEIHRSNMTKLGTDGEPIFREDGKIVKGPNFEKPNIRKVLSE